MQYGMLIDYSLCTGCKSCEVSCRKEKDLPLDEWGILVNQIGPKKLGGEWEWDYVPVPSRLCDLCAERLGRNRELVCVHNCLGDCMKFGTIEEMAAELAKKPKQVLWAPYEA